MCISMKIFTYLVFFTQMARTKPTVRKTPEQLAQMQEERERIYGPSVAVKPTKPKRARIPKKSKKDVIVPEQTKEAKERKNPK